MKHNHDHGRSHDDGPGSSPQLVPVRFEFTHPTAVCVARAFDHWQLEAKTLHSSGAGRWWKETALAPTTHEYCLMVDGQWMPDPLAKETGPNPFGGKNSILKVASSTETNH